MSETLQSLGEFGLIELFRSAAAARPLPRWVDAGIGDDCAVLRLGEGPPLLVTTDLLVEGVHFRLDLGQPWQLGYKAMAVNLSDIAAMGGEPLAAFLGLGLRPELSPGWVRALRDGLLACAGEHGVVLLGGDTVASPGATVLDLTVLGRAAAGQPVLRSGARPGDRVVLGGPVGDAAAGLFLLLAGDGSAATAQAAATLSEAERQSLLAAQLEPRPQLALGRLLAARNLATAMIDVSDGVLQDLGHICAQSGCGAELDADLLPLGAAARRLAAAAGRDARDWGLGGGEDYVLLFCVSPEQEHAVLAACRTELGVEPAVIGTLSDRPGLRLRRDGAWQETAPRGFDHFRGQVAPPAPACDPDCSGSEA